MRIPTRLSALRRIRPRRGGTGRPLPLRVRPGETAAEIRFVFRVAPYGYGGDAV